MHLSTHLSRFLAFALTLAVSLSCGEEQGHGRVQVRVQAQVSTPGVETTPNQRVLSGAGQIPLSDADDDDDDDDDTPQPRILRCGWEVMETGTLLSLSRSLIPDT
jgi:hypothetical protein